MSTNNEDLVAKAKAEREAAESAWRTALHLESAARVADLKAAAEFEEWKLSAADRKHAAALAAESTQLDNFAKLQTNVGNATPDLKGLERGKTTAPDDVLYSTLLTTRALTDAAVVVAKAVRKTTTRPYRVFLTSDSDLVSRDAQLRGLTSRLTTLTIFVQRFSTSGQGTNSQPAESADNESFALLARPASVALGSATALAKLIPGFVELLAANRTLTSKLITIDEEQAITAVAGALATLEGEDFLQFDDTRFLSGDTRVQQQRDDLEAALIALQVKLTEHPDKQDAAWLAQAPIIIEACHDALMSVDTVPPGAGMSPLASAVACELIRESDMDYILVIQPAGGSATQLINDRPLAMKDPIYIAGTVALSYRLIRRKTSQIVSSGIVSASTKMTGSVGNEINLSSSPATGS